jgi:hypothetical protein
VRATLRGSEGNSLKFNRGTPRPVDNVRDVILEASHIVGFAAASRVGAVKIAVS